MDRKAIVFVQSCLRKGRAVSELFSLYLFILPAKSHLPCGIHLSRDQPWEKNENFPTGHHTINALIAFESGLKYVEGPLKDLNALGKLIARFEYSTSTTSEVGECVVRRIDAAIIDGAAEEFKVGLMHIKKFVGLATI